MRIAIFLALLLIALGYAAWKGGAPERVMVGIAIMMILLDRLIQSLTSVDYHTADLEYLALDAFGAVTTTAVALVARRSWPLIAAGLHIFPFLAHLLRIQNIPMDPDSYLFWQVSSSWLLPPLLILATWRHQRRLKMNGSDPSWRAF